MTFLETFIENAARSYGVPTFVISQALDEINERNKKPSKFGDAVARSGDIIWTILAAVRKYKEATAIYEKDYKRPQRIGLMPVKPLPLKML